MTSVDLNADMGESFGAWRMGADETLLETITSANIACGFHAGDPDEMARCMKAAARACVGIGAHPGFADLQGFGRNRIAMPVESMANAVAYQTAAAAGMAHAAGARLRHVKLHGAMANMAAEDEDLAKSLFRAARAAVPHLTLVVIAATAQEAAARALDAPYAAEIFADRAYNDDATLVDRRDPDAVLHDADAAASRVVEMVKGRAVIARSGKRISCRIDTVCLHGDGPEALAMARATRTALEGAGITLAPFG